MKGAERAYALLREALVRSGKVGIARVVFREREYLAAVRPRGEAIALDTMRFAAEIREAGELRLPSGAATELPEKQVELALMLVDQLVAPWDPQAWTDRYQEAVDRMIERKLEGRPIPAARPAAPVGKVVDLAEILRRSLERAGGKAAEQGEGERPAPASRRPARGERRAPREAQAARVVEAPAEREEKPPRKRSSRRKG